jgi:VIT1/CCC1 family predicted Fe2+/Mn2+ transporter
MNPTLWTWLAGLVLALGLVLGAAAAVKGRSGPPKAPGWALWMAALMAGVAAAVVYVILLVR